MKKLKVETVYCWAGSHEIPPDQWLSQAGMCQSCYDDVFAVPVVVSKVGHVSLLGLDEMFCVEYLDGGKWVRGPMMVWMEAEANFVRRVEEDRP